MDYAFSQLAMFFFAYGFLGWCVEVAYAAVREGRFVNRGFLNGPICPIYGFGVVSVVLLLRPLAGNLPLLFASSFAVTTLIELATGFLLEKLFHARWWDYSHRKFNIGGYVCLLFSLVWGAACVVVVTLVHPVVDHAVRLLPDAVLYPALSALFSALAIDLAATAATIRRLGERLKRLTDLAAEIHAVSDEIGRKISSGTLSAKRRAEAGEIRLSEGVRKLGEIRSETTQRIDQSRRALSERIGLGVGAGKRRLIALKARMAGALDERPFGQSRLIDAFPHLTSASYPEALAALRKHNARKRRSARRPRPPKDAARSRKFRKNG